MSTVNYNLVPRAQEIDENGKVVAGGTLPEFKICTATQSNANVINFSELPKAVLFGTRENLNKVMFWVGTSTMADAGAYWTIQAGTPISIDMAMTGTFYFRAYSASVTTIVEGVALL